MSSNEGFRGPDERPERAQNPIEHAFFDINNGPIDLFLNRHHLQIVVPHRDLSEDNPLRENKTANCFVIDPVLLESSQGDYGYRALEHTEAVVLGRDNTCGMFIFGEYTSRAHAVITRRGSSVTIRDLDSKNGTYLAANNENHFQTRREVPHLQKAVGALAQHSAEVSLSNNELYRVAGESIASERHPTWNEDAYFVDLENRTIGVFDGVGGAAGSAEASRLACASVANFLKSVPSQMPIQLAELSMREALELAHQKIIQEGAPGIATTATVAKIFESKNGTPYAMIATAGDSRAYIIRDGKVEHITLDHAYSSALTPEEQRELQGTLSRVKDLSNLSPKEYEAFRQRNIITSCLGSTGMPTITVSNFEIHSEDKLLITSDGIHDNLTTDEIEQIVSIGDPEVIVNDLVVMSRDRSRTKHARAKPDDMTAAMLTYYN